MRNSRPTENVTIAILSLVLCLALTTPIAGAISLTLRVADQDGVDILASRVQFKDGSGAVLEFDAGEVVEIPEGTYTVEIIPGINGKRSGFFVLRRADLGIVVDGTTTELSFEWIVARDIPIALVDQHGIPILASQIDLQDIVSSGLVFGTFFNGNTVDLPITDVSVYPTMDGQFANGYEFVLHPGINGVAQRAVLSRSEEDVLVTALSGSISFEWIVQASIALEIVDQDAAPIPGSEIVLQDFVSSAVMFGSFANGDTVDLPITDILVYPDLRQPSGPSNNQFGNGYDFILFPGVNGILQRPHLQREDQNFLVSDISSLFRFEWIAAKCPLRVVDSQEAEVSASTIRFLEVPGQPLYSTGTSVILPITDETIYGSLGGDIANGYEIRVAPGNLGGPTGVFDFEVLGDFGISPAFVSIEGTDFGLRCTEQATVDLDGDGFSAPEDCDDSDPNTHPGAPDLPGDVIDQDCDGTPSCDPCFGWRNHGHYVSCVAQTVEGLVNNGDLTQEEGDAIVSSAAQSDVGKKEFVPAECP